MELDLVKLEPAPCKERDSAMQGTRRTFADATQYAVWVVYAQLDDADNLKVSIERPLLSGSQ
jgi:hypothetical protein